jgi:hypothetical protein
VLGDRITFHRRHAGLDQRRRAICASAEKLTVRPREIDEADLQTLREAGLTQDEAWDVAEVTATDNFTNRMAMATNMLPNEGPHPKPHQSNARSNTTASAPCYHPTRTPSSPRWTNEPAASNKPSTPTTCPHSVAATRNSASFASTAGSSPRIGAAEKPHTTNRHLADDDSEALCCIPRRRRPRLSVGWGRVGVCVEGGWPCQ